MIDSLSSIDVSAAAEAMLRWLGQALLYGTLLAVLTWLVLNTACRRAGQALHAALWLIVLVKFLVPVGPSWTYSLAGTTQRVTQLWHSSNAPPATPDESAPEASGPIWVWLATVADSAPTAVNAERAALPPVALLLAAAYVLGLFVVATARLWSYVGFAAKCRELPPADARVRTLVTDACRRLGVRRPPAVRVSDEAPAPFILGALRPTLVLARRQLACPYELETVIVHEVAHLRRCDLFVRYVQWLAGTLLFFWPVVAWVNRRIDLAREHACDEWALRHGRLSAGAYARCLLRALHPARSPGWLYRPATMATNRFTIERRIEMVFNTSRNRGPRGSLGLPALLLILAWAGFALTGAAIADEPTKAATAVDEHVVVQDGKKICITKIATGEGEKTVNVDVDVRCVKGDGDIDVPLGDDGEHEGLMRQVWVTKDDSGANTAEIVVLHRLSEARLAEIADAHPSADVDGDGVVSQTEYDAYLIARAMSDPNAVLEEYPMADVNEDGELDATEAARLVSGRMTMHMLAEADVPVEAPDDETGDVRLEADRIEVEIEAGDDDVSTVHLKALGGGDEPFGGLPGAHVAPPGDWLLENIAVEPSTAEVAKYLSVVQERPKTFMCVPREAHVTVEDGEVQKTIELHLEGAEAETEAATGRTMIFIGKAQADEETTEE